jgi:allophanate hydrolase
MSSLEQIPNSITALIELYRDRSLTPRQVISWLLEQARLINSENPVWLHILSDDQIEPFLTKLEQQDPQSLPLYGVPFAIKDNIDLANIPTTAACPEFSYIPKESAFVVELLIEAGAIPLGKTNLDQFATGLVGTRSPYGACKNALNPDYISGGSSSGSALAVANGLALFSLGTDTAGSGRVPAALNNLIGIKPSRGVLSNRGLVPACRSLDCISIFSHNLDDANRVFDVVAQFDLHDPYARRNPFANGPRYGLKAPSECVIGIPKQPQLAFFGDAESESLFTQAVQSARDTGATIIEVDFQPFLDAAKLLYEGPWVAERYLATQPLIDKNPNALLPVTRSIISAGQYPSAADGFKAGYALQACKQKAESVLAQVDCIMTPTVGTVYTIAEVDADPIRLNSNLGYYTNFMNLLDCAAIAIPSGFKQSGVGFGITLFHRAFSDKRLMAYAHKLQQPITSVDPQTHLQNNSAKTSTSTLDVVVCGAHLDGLALNWQLRERGGYLLKSTSTAASYRLYALAGGSIARPALVRDERNGGQIAVEIWRLPAENFGSFVNEIPAPLGIGKVELVDSSWCSGFICEPYGIVGATEITSLGGWRAFLGAQR